MGLCFFMSFFFQWNKSVFITVLCRWWQNWKWHLLEKVILPGFSFWLSLSKHYSNVVCHISLKRALVSLCFFRSGYVVCYHFYNSYVCRLSGGFYTLLLNSGCVSMTALGFHFRLNLKAPSGTAHFTNIHHCLAGVSPFLYTDASS